MKVIAKKTIYLSLVFGLLMSSAACVDKSKTSDLKVKYVIVIGVDAMSPNGIINAKTPIMDDMMANGAYTLNARGVLPTSSSTNWASMVSGSGPEQHGVTSNGWERDDHSLPPVLTGSEEIFPTIFGVAREQRPDMEMGAIYTWSGFGRLIERRALSYDSTQETDELTLEKATTYLKRSKTGFLVHSF